MSTATLSTSFVTQMMILALVAVTRAIQVCVKMASGTENTSKRGCTKSQVKAGVVEEHRGLP